MRHRLAVVISHPTQYYSPWFKYLSSSKSLELMVFYLWDFGIKDTYDPGFGQHVLWDLQLLDGYASQFVKNKATDPGTHHFGGLNNPSLVSAIIDWQPTSILLFGYVYLAHIMLLSDPRLMRIPIIFRGDSHNLATPSSCRQLLSLFARRLIFKRFSIGLAVGKANAKYLIASGIHQSRIYYAPHAVDNQRFQSYNDSASTNEETLRQRLHIPAESPVVLFVGKFESKKRPCELLEAFIQLRHPRAILVFVGSGVLEDELRQRACSCPTGRVHFLGFQNQSAMPSIYRMANLIVLPSFGRAETWGLCINEAMNMGVPAIVSDHVGCAQDLVIPDVTGWIYPAGQLQSLIHTLDNALSDLDRLHQIGLNARSHIQNFSFKQATDGLLSALDSLSERSCGRDYVDVIVPELYARQGGIQIYSRNVIRSMLTILPNNVGIRVFIVKDDSQPPAEALHPRIQYFPCGGSPTCLIYLRFILFQIQALIRQKPVLSFSTHINYAPVQVLISWFSRCPAWASAHGIEVWRLMPGIRKWSLCKLDQLLPVSQYTANKLQLSLGAACPSLSRLPNTYDDKSFTPGSRPEYLLERYGLHQDQPVIFTLSRLSTNDRYKRIRSIIDAIPDLLVRFPDIRLIIGGTGDDYGPLREYIAVRDLDQYVFLPGLIPAAELADHFRLASLFALPSEKEGFGIVFLEATACGCPTLGGNRDGSVDALMQGRFGCLIDPRLPLAPVIQSILDRQGDPMWYDPFALSAAVKQAYGYQAFDRRLSLLFQDIPKLNSSL